jgi:hypothetical protein
MRGSPFSSGGAGLVSRILVGLGKTPVPPLVSHPQLVDHSQALADAIDTATVSVRASDDNGPRVVFISSLLGGAFVFSREESERIIRKLFSGLSDEGVKRGVLAFEARALAALSPSPQEERRKSWVFGWME